jgi:hypothetical protein
MLSVCRSACGAGGGVPRKYLGLEERPKMDLRSAPRKHSAAFAEASSCQAVYA